MILEEREILCIAIIVAKVSHVFSNYPLSHHHQIAMESKGQGIRLVQAQFVIFAEQFHAAEYLYRGSIILTAKEDPDPISELFRIAESEEWAENTYLNLLPKSICPHARPNRTLINLFLWQDSYVKPDHCQKSIGFHHIIYIREKWKIRGLKSGLESIVMKKNFIKFSCGSLNSQTFIQRPLFYYRRF